MMDGSDSKKETAQPDSAQCIVRAVADTMSAEPALEAVKIDRKRRAISVATLGSPSQPDFDTRLKSQIDGIAGDGDATHCAVFKGDGNCHGCENAQHVTERKNLNVERTDDVTTIARVTCPTAPRFWKWRDLPWPKIAPRRVVLPEEDAHEGEWKFQLIAAALCGVFGLAGFFLKDGNASLACYVLSYLAGAWFTAEEVWERLQERELDVHFLMLAVAAGSACIGAWGEGAMLLFLFALSGALEHFAMGRTQREIRSLFKTAPKSATILDENKIERTISIEEIAVGMRLLVKPGDQFPTDGEVVAGNTASDESNLTGEAVPVDKKIGDTVLAGTINLWGAVEITVSKLPGESALQKIIQLIRQAQHLKAPSQRFTDRFGTSYTYAILALSFGMFFVWWLGFGYAPFASGGAGRSAFYRSMTLLVVASPCALVLSIPSAILAAIAWSAGRGILFRGGAAVEKLAVTEIVAMDKTGTLTTGELQVERVESFPAGREKEILELAFSLERLSTHPLARALTRYGKQCQLVPLNLVDFQSVTGMGLRARLGQDEVLLGRREWLAQQSGSSLFNQASAAETGFSEVWVTSGDLAGRILLRDDIRPQARGVVAALRHLGLKTIVLTGDKQSSGDRLKEQLEVDDVRAELKPEQKVEAIHSCTAQGRRVAMIGDGVNDAPSLAAADVGVAMGARGSDAALEQADVVLMHDKLENFLTAIDLSRRARRIIKQNLLISLGTVVILVLLALTGGIPLTIGVLGHEGSTVIVVMNSLRLLFGRVKAPSV